MFATDTIVIFYLLMYSKNKQFRNKKITYFYII